MKGLGHFGLSGLHLPVHVDCLLSLISSPSNAWREVLVNQPISLPVCVTGSCIPGLPLPPALNQCDTLLGATACNADSYSCSHPSAGQARPCLASVLRRGQALSGWDGCRQVTHSYLSRTFQGGHAGYIGVFWSTRGDAQAEQSLSGGTQDIRASIGTNRASMTGPGLNHGF